MKLLRSRRAIKSDNTLPESNTRRRTSNLLPILEIYASSRIAFRFTLRDSSIYLCQQYQITSYIIMLIITDSSKYDKCGLQ